MKHKLFSLWLSGTTCRNWNEKHKIMLENDEWIIFKHASHAAYRGRCAFPPVGNCPAYAVLYKKSRLKEIDREFRMGNDYDHKWVPWKGRLRVDEIIQDCKEYYGIEFVTNYESKEWYEPVHVIHPDVQKLIDQMNSINEFNDIKL